MLVVEESGTELRLIIPGVITGVILRTLRLVAVGRQCCGDGARCVGFQGFAENCNPNMNKEAVTPAKYAAKKTLVKSKMTALNEYELGKSPIRRRLDCDVGAHENGALGKSPVKAALIKETGASLHKHFCRSPRCVANNPDYAVPAPR